MDETRSVEKSFSIPKSLIWEAYLKVGGNKGAAGVDGQSLAGFEQNLRNNLFKPWNRMSSGSYFPEPVKAVPIPEESLASVKSKIRQAWSMRRRSPRVPALRSGFAGFRFPPEVIALAVGWCLRYGLSYRDVEELLAERGITVDHVSVYRWVQRFTRSSSTRHDPAGTSLATGGSSMNIRQNLWAVGLFVSGDRPVRPGH